MATAKINGTVITRQDRTFSDDKTGEPVPLFDVIIYDDEADAFHVYRTQRRADVAGPEFESGALIEDLELRVDKNGGIPATILKNIRDGGGKRF